MLDHVHEWRLTVMGYHCKKCGNSLMVDDIERRLNATERLSAEMAQVGSQYLIQHALTMEFPSADSMHKITRLLKRIVSRLQAYADILEEK